MPRPASKKNTAKPVVKSTKVSTGSAAEKVLEKALKQLDAQSGKLKIARDKLRQKRASVAKKATAASTAALDKAYTAVTTHSVSLSELTNSVRLAKADVRIESVLKKTQNAQEVAQLKLEKAALAMAAKSASDLKAAVEKFEQRWLKQREQENTKKLKLVTARSRTKVKAVEKKAITEASAIRKRAKSLSTKPVAKLGRPGRPAGAVVKTETKSTAPKRRGRPAKVVEKTAVSTEPKRRGRPAKVVGKVAASAEPKRRGRPAKVVVKAAASTEPKRRGRPPKVVASPAKKAATTTSADAPARRGRPPKAKTTSKAKPSVKKSTVASKAGAPKRRGRPPKAANA